MQTTAEEGRGKRERQQDKDKTGSSWAGKCVRIEGSVTSLKDMPRHLPAQPLKASNLLTLLLLTATMLQARRISSRRLVIHVPVKVKTHHHTHTVYKVLHGSGAGGGGSGIKQTVYKIVGFSGEGGGGHGDMGHGSHSPGHSHSQSHSQSHGMGMGMGMGEITYEDRHGCESGKVMPSHRDIFNHYARHDQEAAEDSDYAEERDEFIDVRDAWL
ncbi:uncharacterized protein LOC111595274 [Drosophila hydei]|uniref:Uncharacterized protein LOC111595274 n=1 Tax=Drosophila hydei TaxID=7224 RepID=A0A6J1LJA1_DROHY|nr:uncharacterized protein LOC111595274 [Drosophila hydei]